MTEYDVDNLESIGSKAASYLMTHEQSVIIRSTGSVAGMEHSADESGDSRRQEQTTISKINL